MMHAKNSLTNNADSYLESTEYLDADHPLVAALAEKLARGAESDVERIRAIYLYVRDLRYGVLESFRYLAAGERSASDVLKHGVAFCMGKASSFVALSRAAGVPARVAFQTLDSPEKEFLSPEVRALWGGKHGRPLPWHSLGEAFLNGRWVKLDATIDAPTAARLGKPYTQEFDGITDIHTIEGPILRENGSYADYPPEVGQWYERLAQVVLEALNSAEERQKVGDDDNLWAGPQLEDVARRAVQ
jgi:transglutaminase-like putative cysteine protease